MAFAFKFLSDFSEVVDLAVESNPDCLIFVGHRLLAGRREIDNTQSFVAETHGHFRRI